MRIAPCILDDQLVTSLQGTAVDNGRLLAVRNVARLGAAGLDGLDNLHASIVSDLAKDDVATVEPVSHDRGNEELRAVPVDETLAGARSESLGYLRVRASVGHGEDTGPGVAPFKVLVGKLLAVDGLATRALHKTQF